MSSSLRVQRIYSSPRGSCYLWSVKQSIAPSPINYLEGTHMHQLVHKGPTPREKNCIQHTGAKKRAEAAVPSTQEARAIRHHSRKRRAWRSITRLSECPHQQSQIPILSFLPRQQQPAAMLRGSSTPAAPGKGRWLGTSRSTSRARGLLSRFNASSGWLGGERRGEICVSLLV